MSIPEMSGTEALQYLNGRVEASMFVLSMVVGSPMLKPADLIDAFEAKCLSVRSIADSSPENQAYVNGYVSLLPFLKDNLGNAEQGAAMNLSKISPTEH